MAQDTYPVCGCDWLILGFVGLLDLPEGSVGGAELDAGLHSGARVEPETGERDPFTAIEAEDKFNSTHLAVCIVAALHKGDDDNDKEDNKDIAGDFSN